MKQVDYFIVGGSATGTTAAESIRIIDPDGSIVVVTDENHVFYSRVLIPHYIRGKVKREQVFLRKSEMYDEHKIELIKGVSISSLEPSKKIIKLSNGDSYQYGKLLLSIGGRVIPLNIPGADFKNLFYMRTIEDADKIIKSAKKSKKALIIGGGFIGLEFASGFKACGIEEVTLLVKEDYFWKGKLDSDSASVLSGVLKKNGVTIETLEEVESLTNKGDISLVKTKTGKTFEVDIVGVGIGIRSDLSWLNGTGVKVDRGIITNEYLETSADDIYAAGDCAQFHDVIFNREHIMGNWANATSQGATVGKTMAGEKTLFETASSYSISFFDGSCSFIGVTDEKFADEVISRGSVADKRMTRIFIKKIGANVRVVGATVINQTADVAPLTAAVKSKVDIRSHKDKLVDTSFELNKILPTSP